MESARRMSLMLAWTWPVPAFKACPLLGALWCFALERAEIHVDELEFALLQLAAVREPHEKNLEAWS